MMRRIHITGASGSGCTTLGRALAERLGSVHLDTDTYFWLPSDPPFQTIREGGERRALLGDDLERHASLQGRQERLDLEGREPRAGRPPNG